MGNLPMRMDHCISAKNSRKWRGKSRFNKTDGDGNFTLKNNANALDYYMVRTGPANVIYLVLKGGETIELSVEMQKHWTFVHCERFWRFRTSQRTPAVWKKNLGDSLNQVYATFREENLQERIPQGCFTKMLFRNDGFVFKKVYRQASDFNCFFIRYKIFKPANFDWTHGKTGKQFIQTIPRK